MKNRNCHRDCQLFGSKFCFQKSEDFSDVLRGGSRAAATSKMERFVIKVNGFQPLTIITKRSILYVAAALEPALVLDRIQYKET